MREGRVVHTNAVLGKALGVLAAVQRKDTHQMRNSYNIRTRRQCKMVEPLSKDTHEMRTPLKKGHIFALSEQFLA